jgi:hypothetical protein
MKATDTKEQSNCVVKLILAGAPGTATAVADCDWGGSVHGFATTVNDGRNLELQLEYMGNAIGFGKKQLGRSTVALKELNPGDFAVSVGSDGGTIHLKVQQQPAEQVTDSFRRLWGQLDDALLAFAQGGGCTELEKQLLDKENERTKLAYQIVESGHRNAAASDVQGGGRQLRAAKFCKLSKEVLEKRQKIEDDKLEPSIIKRRKA